MLLDTHIVIWWLRDEVGRLTPSIMTSLGDHTIDVVVSAVVVWEIAIKRAIGKIVMPTPDVPAALEDRGARLLDITPSHADHVATLPLHHRDPFDRLLIAQAQLERMPIVSVDPRFADYDVELIS